jgi:hypothetical protein
VHEIKQNAAGRTLNQRLDRIHKGAEEYIAVDGSGFVVIAVNTDAANHPDTFIANDKEADQGWV